MLRAKWALVAGPAPASPGESSALAVYGGLSRTRPGQAGEERKNV